MFKLKIIITLLAFSILSGCYELEKVWHQGTTKGVGLCIENNLDTSKLLSESLVRSQCIKEHTKDLPYKVMKARASVWINDKNVTVSISNGKNLYENYVITEISLSANIYDSDGKLHTVSEEVENVWIEPSDFLSGRATIEFDFSLSDYDTFCSDLDQKKSCKSWNLASMRGVEIKL